MAKLTRNLSEPSPQGGSIAPVRSAPRSPNTSTADSINRLTDVLSVGGSIFKASQKAELVQRNKQEALEKGQAIGNAQTGLLFLEDERNEQSLDKQSIENEVFDITKDGITEEEQKRLDVLERQKNKFSLLDPRVFQTRSNALHKQALADTANLAIQPQINALFQQGRSRVIAPVSKAQDQFNQGMDITYGVGNWTAVDAGRERGKVTYTANLQAQAIANFDLVSDQANLSMSVFGDTAVRSLDNMLNEKGFLTDEDKNLYTVQIGNARSGIRTQVQEAVLEARKNGQDISKPAKAFMADLDASNAAYISLLEGDKRFGSRTNAANVMKNAVSIQSSVISLQNPSIAKSATGTMGGGSGGDIMTMSTMLGNPSMFDAVISNLPESMQGHVTKTSMMEQGAAVVAAAFQPNVSLPELVKFGIPASVAKAVGSIGLESADVKGTMDNYLSVYNDVEYEGVESVLDMLNSPKKINNITALKGDVMPTATHMLEAISKQLTPLEREHLEVLEDGSLHIKTPTDPATRIKMGRFSLYTNQLLKKYGTFLDNYSTLLPNKEQFYEALLPKKEESKGDTE